MKMATKVVDYKLMDGKKYYKVKWECSWVLEDNLNHCQELVEQFWEFIDRVKYEDDRTPALKRARMVDDERRQPKHISNVQTCVQNNKNFGLGDANCSLRIKLEDNSEEEIRVTSPTSSDVISNINNNNDNGHIIQVSNGNIVGQKKTSIKSVLRNTVLRQDSRLENRKYPKPISYDSIITSDKTLQTLHYSNSLPNFNSDKLSEKRIPYIAMNEDSENSMETDDIEGETVRSSSEDIFEPDLNDNAFHWNNPYVRISFRCRICNEEQLFMDKDTQWKNHFLTHIEGARLAEELNKPCLIEDISQEGIEIIQDSEKPWIQKVEYIIQRWGVNQYFRLVFLCRSCGKEQQPLHTGNWRNHYNSHIHNRPHSCQKCSKTFKSKSYLNQHLKMVHDDIDGVGLRSCFVCNKVFTRRLDMRRHIAEVHQIDPNNHLNQNEWEYESTNQTCDLQIGENTDETINNFHETLTSKQAEKPLDKNFMIDNSTKTEHKKVNKKNTNSSNENLFDKSNFKHVCGICQERFKKKVDLKCHTVNVHCIDISNSTKNVDSFSNGCHRESLTPTMVNLVKNKSVRDINNGFSDSLRIDRIVGQAKQNEPDKVLVLVKEEIYPENDAFCGNELTIDEDRQF